MTKHSKKILIIGCGVSGLSCGIRLLEAGYEVTIIARELPPDTTSNAAGAIWYPFKCYPEDKALEWGRTSLQVYYRLMEEHPGCGVYPVTFTKYFDQPVADPFWKPAVRNFRRGEPGNLPALYQDAYVFEVPFIDTPVYMPWLMRRFREKNGVIRQEEFATLEEVQHRAGIIINCSGIGARQVANDPEVYPVRGQSVKVKAESIGGHYLDQNGPLSLCYVLPRKHDCLLGGTAEEHDYQTSEDTDTREHILDKACRLDPSLRIHDILGYTVGLRPARYEVRLEKEERNSYCTVIHNYGHGGAGFTLAWGCAEEVWKRLKNNASKKYHVSPSLPISLSNLDEKSGNVFPRSIATSSESIFLF